MNHAVNKLIDRLKSEEWNELLFERTLALISLEKDKLVQISLTIQLVDAIEIANPEAALLLLREIVTAYPDNLCALEKLQNFFNIQGKKAKAFAVELEIQKLKNPVIPLRKNIAPKKNVPLTWSDVAVAPFSEVLKKN